MKWFSNKKGYGFITPSSGTTGDIFVHQSTISSEGYRTLDEGWAVEFDIGDDEDGKIKAVNVTAIGGGPCTGPRSSRRRKPDIKLEGDSNQRSAATVEGSKSNRSSGAKTTKPVWHDILSDEVKATLVEKGVRITTGTIDIAVGSSRIKLGTRGYSSMAQSNKVLCEGSFICESDGKVTFEWKRALEYDEEWRKYEDLSTLIEAVSLSDDSVECVGIDETMATLMGPDIPDPKESLVANGFEMRRVVLTTKRK